MITHLSGTLSKGSFFAKYDWSPNPVLNLIYGENGTGKSLLLESIIDQDHSIKWSNNSPLPIVTVGSSDECGSSGEMRWDAIFGALQEYSEDEEFVFLLDDAGLHLSLSRMQRLVSELLETWENGQFILVTHSPDVIASYWDSTVSIFKIRTPVEKVNLK